MIEMACPSCGRAGQVPKEKLNSRLVCRKCHVVFHMDPGGRAVLGEPNQAGSKDKKKAPRAVSRSPWLQSLGIPTLDQLTSAKSDLSEYSFPVKPIAGVLVGLVALWFIWGMMSGPGESVADRAQTAAQALARGDLNYLKSFASDDTRDDVVRWYDVAHTKLDQAQKDWPSKEAIIQVVIVEEDRKLRRGEVEAFIMPAMAATTSPAPVAPAASDKSASDKPAVAGPLSFHLHWIWDGKHWMLDGRQSFAMATR